MQRGWCSRRARLEEAVEQRRPALLDHHVSDLHLRSARVASARSDQIRVLRTRGFAVAPERTDGKLQHLPATLAPST